MPLAEMPPPFHPRVMCTVISQFGEHSDKTVDEVVANLKLAADYALQASAFQFKPGEGAKFRARRFRTQCTSVTRCKGDPLPSTVFSQPQCGEMCSHNAPSGEHLLMYLKLCKQFALLGDRFGIGRVMANLDLYISLRIQGELEEEMCCCFLNLRLASGAYGPFRAAQTFHKLVQVSGCFRNHDVVLQLERDAAFFPPFEELPLPFSRSRCASLVTLTEEDLAVALVSEYVKPPRIPKQIVACLLVKEKDWP